MRGYRIFNGSIYIHPLSEFSVEDGLKLVYQAQRTLPTATDEDTGIKDDKMLIDWALYQLLLSDGDETKAMLYSRSFDRRKANIRAGQPRPVRRAQNYWR